MSALKTPWLIILKTGLFISLLAFSSCTTIEGYVNLKKPKAAIEKVELTGLNFDRADLLYKIRIKNSNPIALKLSSLEYALKIEEGSLLNGTMDQGLELSANGESLIEVPVSVGFKQLLDIAESAREKSEIGYSLELGLGFTVPGFGSVKVPLSYSDTLPVPKLPSLRIASLRVKRVSLTRIDLEIDLRVSNPNTFSLALRSFSYDLNVAGRTWVEGTPVRTLTFENQGEGSVVLPLSLNIVEVGRSVVDMLSGNKNLDYRLNGDTIIDSDLPLLDDYHFNFSSSGTTEVFR